MAGGGGHGGMKHFWHVTMMVLGFTLLPASLVLLIYSFGMMLLKGQWEFFVWCAVGFIACVIAFVTLSILGE